MCIRDSDIVGGLAHDDVAQRGLARTVGAHEDVDAAFLDIEVDRMEYLLAIDAGREAADG